MIAQAFGIDGYRVSTLEGVKAALDEAVALNKPALIHVDVCREHPDSGGKAFGWWDVPIPAYMEEKRALYEEQMKEEMV